MFEVQVFLQVGMAPINDRMESSKHYTEFRRDVYREVANNDWVEHAGELLQTRHISRVRVQEINQETGRYVEHTS